MFTSNLDKLNMLSKPCVTFNLCLSIWIFLIYAFPQVYLLIV